MLFEGIIIFATKPFTFKNPVGLTELLKYLLGLDLRILWLSSGLLQLLGVYAHAIIQWVLVTVDDSWPVEAVNDHLWQAARLHRLA